MMSKNGWDYLVRGEYRKAASVYLKEGRATQSAPDLMSAGIVFLLVGDFNQARSLFDELRESHFRDIEASYQFAGAVRWICDERADAVEVWKLGMNCTYSDDAGGITTPLILWYAAKRESDDVLDAFAAKRLRAKLRQKRAVNWPGPLAQFVLGEADLKDVYSAINDEEAEFARPCCLAQIDFYRGIVALCNGNDIEFNLMMNAVTAQKNAVMQLEYHLAWHELKGRKDRSI